MLFSKVRRGELDREITFIKKTIAVGASNADNITSWVEVATNPNMFARKRDLGGQDVVVDEQIQYAQRTLWTIDYRTDLTTENRLVYGGKVFAILSITDNESGRNRYLDIMSSQINAETWT
jgi:SPP1 family predicted phage head-tail adaptor